MVHIAVFVGAMATMVGLGCSDSAASADAGFGDAMAAADATWDFDAAAARDARALDAAPADAAPDAASSDAASPDGGPSCPPAAYVAYFAANPAVAAATFDSLDAIGQAILCDDLVELESTGKVSVDEPAESATCVEPTSCTYITPTPDERAHILAAKYAHAIWIDHHATVPWSLSGYSPAELAGLFDPNVLFRSGTHFMSVVDFSPSEAWAYVVEQGLVAATIADSIVAVIDDLRTTDADIDFLHGIEGLGDPVNTAYTLDEALRTWVDRGGTGTFARISRRGCHSMSRVQLGLLRSMNIPGAEVHDGQWYVNGHSTPTWPIIASVVPHGDDLYGATVRVAPSAQLLAPMSFYTAVSNTAVCAADAGCLGTRYASLNAIAYPSNYTTQRCCSPASYGYASCREYLDEGYTATLTTAEIDAAEVSLLASCP